MFTSAREVLLCTVYEPEGSWLGVRKLLLHLQQHNVLSWIHIISAHLSGIGASYEVCEKGQKKEKVVRL